MKTRKNLSELSSNELQHLICAMKELKDNGDWDKFVDVHASHFDHIHSSISNHSGYQQFLPWHRIFILKFEEKLQKINSTIELPYWRWIGMRKIPDGFEQNLFGWMGVTRALTHNGDNLPTASDVEATLNKTSFESFSNSLEELHNRVHAWVGGTMSTANSAKDPLFWFHHAYCDKLYLRWIAKQGVMAWKSWDLHDPYEEYSIAEVLSTSELGYTYSDL